MNTLRLDIINLHAPYRVRQRDDKPQTYYFKTDFGIEFNISLEEDFSIVPSGAYALDITNREHKRSPLDPKFKQTLITIVEEFFEQNNDVMLYITETGDKKQAFRSLEKTIPICMKKLRSLMKLSQFYSPIPNKSKMEEMVMLLLPFFIFFRTFANQ